MQSLLLKKNACNQEAYKKKKKEQKLLNCYSLFLVKMKEATATTVRINPLNEHHCNNPHAARKLQTFSLWWLFNLMGLVCKL